MPETSPSKPFSAGLTTKAAEKTHAEDAQPRLLFISDEPVNHASLSTALRGEGYLLVRCIGTDESTVYSVLDYAPDLIVLELGDQPELGMAALQRLKSDHGLKRIGVIVLSISSKLSLRLRALDAGAADCLIMPVDTRELALRIRNSLVVKASRDQWIRIDQLTGLPTRDALLIRLDWAIKQAVRQNSVGAILHIGLDRFKQLNDALGHAVADELLHNVSERLIGCLRESDMIARGAPSRSDPFVTRGSGDDFSVLLPVMDKAADAMTVARRLLERAGEPFLVAGKELVVSCRIGAAVFPQDSIDKEDILKHAAMAMRGARSADTVGIQGFQFFSASLHASSLQRITIEHELRQAIDRGEFALYYQPQVTTDSGVLSGVEALLRWRHPTRGLLTPLHFLATAEEAGLLSRIGAWVLAEALQQFSRWCEEHQSPPMISVNVSSQQLNQPDLYETIKEALSAAGVPGQSLCLELTESAIIESGLQVTETLAAVKQLGVRLALDDFGTGFSSLTHLRRFPIDELKIDRSFVMDCDKQGSASKITASIIAMAQSLDLHLVAEGVETTAQLDFSRAHGTDSIQGFLYARPMCAQDFGLLLKTLAGSPSMLPVTVASNGESASGSYSAG